jgi:catalase-peroxidase
VFTPPGTLTNDFFVNLLDMGTEWKPSATEADVFEGRDRKTGAVKWTGTRSIWSSARTPSCAPWPRSTPSADAARPKFVQDFVAAWTKVMNLDRFDLATVPP